MPAVRRHRYSKRPRRRAALELLAGAGQAGCDATALLALGFAVPDLLMLLRDGLAVPRADRVVNGRRRQFDLSRLFVTQAGREALAEAPEATAPTRRMIFQARRE
jgi:hypothetical protein